MKKTLKEYKLMDTYVENGLHYIFDKDVEKLLDENSGYCMKTVINKTIEECKKEGMPTKDISDGYHTFGELYHHRALLFASVLLNPSINKFAWKSLHHFDEANDPMYEGMFIVGISCEIDGAKYEASYHYDIDPYWDTYFKDIKVVENAPPFTGYTPSESIENIFKIVSRWYEIHKSECKWYDDKNVKNFRVPDGSDTSYFDGYSCYVNPETGEAIISNTTTGDIITRFTPGGLIEKYTELFNLDNPKDKKDEKPVSGTSSKNEELSYDGTNGIGSYGGGGFGKRYVGDDTDKEIQKNATGSCLFFYDNPISISNPNKVKPRLAPGQENKLHKKLSKMIPDKR